MRRVALSILLASCSATMALSCPSQTGKVIFSDDFADGDGGWNVDANIAYVKSAVSIKIDSKTVFETITNLTFDASEGDYCADFAFPGDAPASDSPDTVGLIFLAADDRNRFYFSVSSSGKAYVSRLANNETSYLLSGQDTAAINKDPGAVNQLRVVYKNQKATFYVNGVQLKVIRIPLTPGANHFGFWAGSGNAAPAKERVTLVKSYAVTEPN